MSETAYTKVSILGEEYRVSGETRSASLEDLAAFVDGRIDEVRRRGQIVDMKRIAVLTALNLADELFHERARSRDCLGRIVQQREKLDAALNSTGAHEIGVGSSGP